MVSEDYTPASYPGGRGGRKVNNLPQPNTWKTLGDSDTMPSAASALSAAMALPPKWRAEAEDLIVLWQARLAHNKERYAYYDGKNRLKDLGISTPPSLLSLETVVGWPNKAVMALSTRSRFDGFSAQDDSLQADLDGIARRSSLRVKYRQAVETECVYGCSFATVGMTPGGARIDVHDAEHAAARWDDAQNRVAYGMTLDFAGGEISGLTLYSEDANVYLWFDGAVWQWMAVQHSMGRPLMEAFAYRPTQRKPLGQSRITRAVMSITDSAVRCALGGDISFQFAVAPQKVLLGADQEAFQGKTKWEAYIGNIMGVGYNGVDGVMPQFMQMQQASMQQYVDFMRSLAARFSGETNVPISQLGVIHDNPSSAEAIYAANEPLIIECEDFNDSARDSLKTLGLMAIAGELDVPLDELPAEYADFMPNFRNPAMPSVVSQTDAMVKIASVVPGFAGTDVFFEQIGFAEDTRKKAENEIARNNASFSLANLLNGADNGNA